MKRTLLIAMCIGLSACAKNGGFSSVTSLASVVPPETSAAATTPSTTTSENSNSNPTAPTTPAASATPPPTPSSPPVISIPSITSAEASSITNLLGSIAGTIFNNLSLMKIAANGTQQENVTQTISCPAGGSASFTAQGSLSVNLGFPQTTASLSSANATITFTNCQIDPSAGPSIELNGSVTVASVQASATGAVLAGTFTAQGSDQLSGDIQVAVASASLQCSVTLSDTNNASGTLKLSPLAINSSVTANVDGTVCGQAVNESVQGQEQF